MGETGVGTGAAGGEVADTGIAAGEWILPVIYYGFVLFLLLVVFVRKREPASALAWSLAIALLFVIGPLFFVLFGLRPAPKSLRKKIAHRAEFDARFAVARAGAASPLEPQERGARASGGAGAPTGAADGGAAEHERRDDSPGRWTAVGRMLEDLGEAPRRGGNSVRLFSEGFDVSQRVAAAIEEARHHIHIEFYIFRDDDTGKRLAGLLAGKSREGLEVRLIVDGQGSFNSWRLLRRVRRAGGEAAVFRPLFSVGRLSPNLRNHRKTVICDGRVGFLGGMNVGEEYMGKRGRRGREWYDLHMEVHGPSVRDLQRIFAEDWDFATGNTLDDPAFFPEVRAAGKSPVQIIAGGPDYDVNPIRQAFFAAFARAQKRIHVTTPYIVPDRGLLDALATAAMAGVEVHVVTQAPPPDHRLVYYCSLYYMEELLASGVRVYEYRPGMTHAKAVSIDGEWAMVGTANLDNRSMFLNFEQMAVLDGEEEARLVESTLAAQVARSRELTLEELSGRPRLARLASEAARLLSPLL